MVSTVTDDDENIVIVIPPRMRQLTYRQPVPLPFPVSNIDLMFDSSRVVWAIEEAR
jgi:hypothetical protein